MSKSDLHVTSETDLGYGHLFAVLLRRRFWLLGVFCGVLCITTLKTLTIAPTYESSMQLLVESNYQGKKQDQAANSENQFADSSIEIDNATQINLMRSSQLIQKAVNLLRSEYPTITVDEIRKSLVLKPLVDDDFKDVKTKIFEANYSDKDPIKTQKVLGALQKIYLDYNLQQQKLRLAKGLAFIDEQLPAVYLSVNQAEGALKQFRKSQNLIDPEQQAKAITDALNATEQERQLTKAEYQDTQAQYAALQQQLALSPRNALISSRLSQSARYQALLNEIQKTELDLAQQRQRYTDAHPIVQNLVGQHQKQLTLLQQESARTLGQNSAQLKDKGEGLLTEGQLGAVELDLVSKLVQAQTTLLGLRARQQTLANKEQQLRAELSRFPGLIAEYHRLQPLIELKRNTLEQLLKARQELSLEVARGGFNWQVVEPPQSGLKIGPNRMQNLLLGIVAGLILGSVAAFLREGVDDTVHAADELKNQAGLPLLGTIPDFAQVKVIKPMISLPFCKPQAMAGSTIQMLRWPAFRESLDLIYKNIQLLNSDSPIRSLMITSALAGEGKSTLILGLAISAARLHQRVLIIDADLRRPSLHNYLNLPNEQGLSSLLANDINVPIHSCLHTLKLSGCYIDILTSGPTSTDPANLLSSERMGELITSFEHTYDLVLLDCPPVLGAVDTILAASFCSGVVMLGWINRVTRTDFMKAIDMLRSINVIGIVASGTDSKNSYIPYTEVRAQASSDVPALVSN